MSSRTVSITNIIKTVSDPHHISKPKHLQNNLIFKISLSGSWTEAITSNKKIAGRNQDSELRQWDGMIPHGSNNVAK